MAKKKTYRKPGIKQVELVPEEAVLTNCKMGSGTTYTETCARGGGVCSNKEPGS